MAGPGRDPHRSKKPNVPQDTGDIDEAVETIDDDPLASDIANYIDDQEAVVTVYRINQETGGNPMYLTKMLPKEFDLETIRQQFGGGRFSVRIRVGSRMVAKKIVEIEGPPIFYTPRTDSAAPSTAALAARGFLDPQTERVMNLIDARIGELKNQLGGGQSNLEQTLRLMTMFKEVFQQPAQASLPADQITQAILKGLEIGQAGEGGIPWASILDKLGPTLQAITVALSQPRRVAAPASRPPQSAQPGQPASSAPPASPAPPQAPPIQVNSPVPPFIQEAMNAYGPVLFAAAKAGKSPELYADLLLDNLPLNLLPELDAFMAKEGCLSEMAVIYPAMLDAPPWWEQFRNAIKTGLQPDEDEQAQ